MTQILRAAMAALLIAVTVAAQPPDRRTDAPPPQPETERLLDLPAFSEARIVTTTNPGGAWHFKGGVRRDNTGDGQVFLFVRGDRLFYGLMLRMGTPPPGGCWWEKPYDGNPYEGWSGAVVGKNKPIKALPGLRPHSHGNIDTHVGWRNPLTGVTTLLHGVKPGARPIGKRGVIFSIQRATSVNLGVQPENYTRYPNELFLAPHPDAPWENAVVVNQRTGELWGGVAESSILLDPQAAEVLVFTVGKTIEPADAFGQRGRWRIGRTVFSLKNFDTNPVGVRDPAPGPASYVFDQKRDGGINNAYGETDKTAVWGTANTVLQPHVSINTDDNILHLVAHGKKPNTRGHPLNLSDGFGHWWSDDGGRTWHADINNPLVTRDGLGFPDIRIANRLNSPNLLWDYRARKVYWFFWGNKTGQQNKLGTRMYCMEASF